MPKYKVICPDGVYDKADGSWKFRYEDEEVTADELPSHHYEEVKTGSRKVYPVASQPVASEDSETVKIAKGIVIARLKELGETPHHSTGLKKLHEALLAAEKKAADKKSGGD